MGLRFSPQFSRSNKLNAPQISSSRPSRNSYARIARNRLQRVASDPKLLRPHAYPFIVFMFFSLFNSQPTNNPSSPDRIIKSQVPWEREKKQPTDRPSKKTGEKLGEVVTLSQRAKASLDTTHFFFLFSIHWILLFRSRANHNRWLPAKGKHFIEIRWREEMGRAAFRFLLQCETDWKNK